MSSIIPNSTPTPNFYYDQLEHLLTPDEWKVLTYAVRRIFGFEKNRDSTYATISLSTFENGVTYQDKETGEVIRLSYGCGMSRPRISACLSALVKFGILRRGRNTKDGRVWRLETDENKIDFDGLWARFNAQQEAAAQRVAKAAQASADKRRKPEASTADVLGEEVRQSYPQEYDSPTTTGKAVVPTESNEKATGKQDSPVLENAQEAHDDPPALPVDTSQSEQPTQPAKPPMDYVGCRAAFLAVKWFGEGTVDNAVNMNYGRSKKGEWADGNLSRPMTAEQIRGFPNWYFMSKAKGGAGMDRRTMSLPTRPGKFKDHAVNYLAWLDEQIQPAPEPELDGPHAYLKRIREERDRAREAAFLSAS